MIPSPTNPTTPTAAPASNVMSQSMMVPSSSPLTEKNDLMTSSTNSLNMKTGKKYIPSRSRADLAAKEREREDRDRRLQVEERRKEIEKFELERKEAIIAKNKERDLRLVNQRKNSRSNMEFAFGSSAPRMMEPRVDSGSGYWGTRSVSGQTMFERSSTSQ